jgi:hypothetical protein
MQPTSHFNFFVRGLLQLCSYLIQQLPSRYKISINTDLFLSAFTMEDNNGERVRATSWPGAPDGSAYDTTAEADVVSAPNTMDTSSDSQNTNADAIGQLGIHTGQSNSIVIRRMLALKWIEQQKKCYRFLPTSPEETPDWEEMIHRINNGPHGVRHMKSAKAKKPSGK